jgi:hypothetical protein
MPYMNASTMPTRTENKKQLVSVVSRVLDAPMQQYGFRRRTGGLMFSRKRDDAKQEFHAFFESKPLGYPEHEVRLTPQLRVKMPIVAAVAMDMVRDPALLANVPEIILALPLELAAPKTHRAVWLVTDPSDMEGACARMYAFFEQWGLPFLEEYTTPKSMTCAYEREDERPIRDKQWHIYIAAAYWVQNNKDAARQVLEDHLGKAASRRRYSAAFDYVA